MAGIFAEKSDLFTINKATIRFRGKVMGGVPQDPRLISTWIRVKTGLSDQGGELTMAMLRTMRELGYDVKEGMSLAELMEMEDTSKVADSVAAKKNTNGFKTHDAEGVEVGPYLESRQAKALIKEVVNTLFAGDRWLRTGKGPRAVVAERLFVDPDVIPFRRDGEIIREADGLELFIGHTVGPKGPQSNLTMYQYVVRPTIELIIRSAEDIIPDNMWADIFTLGEEIGLGSLRSQSYGRFDVIAWEQVKKGRQIALQPKKAATAEDREVATTVRRKTAKQEREEGLVRVGGVATTDGNGETDPSELETVHA